MHNTKLLVIKFCARNVEFLCLVIHRPGQHSSLAQQPIADHGRLVLEVFYITHNDTTQSVALLWTRDRPVAETSTWQHTALTTDDIHAAGGTRTRNSSKQAASDPRLRPLGHCDWFIRLLVRPVSIYIPCMWGNLRERDHLENPDVDGRIIFKWLLEKWGGGTDWIDVVQDGDKWWAFVNAVMSFWFIQNAGSFLRS